MPHDVAVPVGSFRPEAGEDVPEIATVPEAVEAAPVTPLHPQLGPRSCRPAAQNLLPVAVELDVVIRCAGSRQPAEQRCAQNPRPVSRSESLPCGSAKTPAAGEALPRLSKTTTEYL